jgi:hypothetical protein
MLNVLIKWKYSTAEATAVLQELPKYQGMPKSLGSFSLLDYWKSVRDKLPYLSGFANRVLSIVPHSATCERLFSKLGATKTKTRNKLTPGHLEQLAHIKESIGYKQTKRKLTDEDKVVDAVVSDELGDADEIEETVQTDGKKRKQRHKKDTSNKFLSEMFPNRGLTRMVLEGKFQTMEFPEIMPGRSGDEPASAEEVLARLAASRK